MISIIILIIILLLLLLRSCQNNEEISKENAINDNCMIQKDNLSVINELLSRSDLCSVKWYQDLDDVIKRLTDQNTYLENTNKELYLRQLDLIKQLELFKKDQSSEVVEKLKESVNDYFNKYKTTCSKGV